MADYFVGLVAGVSEHCSHALFNRQDNGQLVGPIFIEKQLLQILFAIGIDQARRRGMGKVSLTSPLSSIG